MDIFKYMDNSFFNEFQLFKEEIDGKRDKFLHIDHSLLNSNIKYIDNLGKIQELCSGRVNIQHKGILFETVINLKKGDYLYVILNGAREK